ncbi:MAG: hypothetical protein ISQ41_05185 [Flavobacteriaceae bacterium]|nr:hypothetical protein [Flavobacteriaceae bacterium]
MKFKKEHRVPLFILFIPCYLVWLHEYLNNREGDWFDFAYMNFLLVTSTWVVFFKKD